MIAMRLAERLGLAEDEARQAFYGCLLFYVGCTADAETEASLFAPGALLRHFAPVMFGSSRETTLAILRALADPDSPAPVRLLQGVARMPRAGRSYGGHLDAMCEVAEMLCDDLGMPAGVRDLFGDLTARWDGRGPRSKARGERIPVAMRVIHVAQDAAFHQFVGGVDAAAQVIRARSGHAFDPAVVSALVDDPAGVLAPDDAGSVWEATLALEPPPWLTIGRRRARSGPRRDGSLRRRDRHLLPRARGGGVRARAPRPHGSRPAAGRGDPGAPVRPRPRPRPGGRQQCRVDEADRADRRRVGAGPAAPVLHRAGDRQVRRPGSARPRRREPPRAPRRQRLPPRRDRGDPAHERARARRGRRLSHAHRAAPAPRCAARRPRPPRRSARPRPRGSWTPTRCRPCSARQGSRSRGSRDRRA